MFTTFANRIAFTFLIFPLLSACGQSAKITADKTPRPVKVQYVERQTNTSIESLPARLEPIKQADVAFRVPGTIASINVREGQSVSKGQSLMSLDPHDFQVQVEEYEARLIDAKAQLTQAISEQNRLLQAAQDDAIARVDIDRAKTGVERASASVEVVEKRLTIMQDALRYSQLKAPYDALVAQIKVEPFESILPSMGVIKLHGLQGYQVTFDASESLVKQLNIGMITSVEFGQTNHIEATIVEISHSPNMLSQTYQVVAELAQQPEHGVAGQSVRILLNLPTQTNNQMLVASSAVKGDSMGQYVMIATPPKALLVPVKVHGYRKGKVSITGNVKPGDMVITVGSQFINDGDNIGEILVQNDKVVL